MSHQKNVQAQVATRRAAMVSTASSFQSLPAGVRKLLTARGFRPQTHVLLEFGALPECCANVYAGKFVSPDRKFVEFEMTTSADGSACVTVDEWVDVTDKTEVDFRKPGIGKTFGALALELLAELHGDQKIRDSEES